MPAGVSSSGRLDYFMRILYGSIAVMTVCLLGAQPKPEDKPSTSVPATIVEGTWQVSWEVRLGTAHATVQLKQEGSILTGTFQEMGVTSRLSGTVQGKNVSFEVQFPGPRPYTIEFTGTFDKGKMSGTSHAKGVEGAGAYLGHGGEVVLPDHPWTATREARK